MLGNSQAFELLALVVGVDSSRGLVSLLPARRLLYSELRILGCCVTDSLGRFRDPLDWFSLILDTTIPLVDIVLSR